MMKTTNGTIANLIKVGAVLTAIPRWVVALLASEGFVLPASWLPVWVPFSAVASMAMAAVEGFAFMYVFNVWAGLRKDDNGKGTTLLVLACTSAAAFVAVLTPSIAASVRGVPLSSVLPGMGWLLAWSVAVALSTITIVIAVGYAQRLTQPEPFPSETAEEQYQPDIEVLEKPANWQELTKTDKAVFLLEAQYTPEEIQAEIGCSRGTVRNAQERVDAHA